MVEAQRLSSLAGELSKFFFVSSVVFASLIALVLFLLGGANAYYSIGAGFLVAFVWVLFTVIWVKNKFEELFGKILYIVELLEEKHKEKAVVPIPIHEEMVSIVSSIKDLLNSFEERYRKELKELEAHIDIISENSSKIIEALEKVNDGYVNVEFPSGLDPVGAIGQALQQIFEFYSERFYEIKYKLENCRNLITALSSHFEKYGDKIDKGEVQRLVEDLKYKIDDIEKELRFIKNA
jgi:ABC-type multidrug transport system fused ATPase/permease subunit